MTKMTIALALAALAAVVSVVVVAVVVAVVAVATFAIGATSSGANHTSPSILQQRPQPVHPKSRPSFHHAVVAAADAAMVVSVSSRRGRGVHHVPCVPWPWLPASVKATASEAIDLRRSRGRCVTSGEDRHRHTRGGDDGVKCTRGHQSTVSSAKSRSHGLVALAIHEAGSN